ncbi:hypothetical protein N8346_01665 [Flavobacteriaceae bacterium]|nr:hypothetical protein [Flavobacteriaceae bacterium]
MKIEIILLGVIGLVFLVDFIMNSRKKLSIDNVVDQIEGGEPVKTNNPLNYLLKRKRNIITFVLLVVFIKLVIHYFIYPNQEEFVNYDKEIQIGGNSPAYLENGDEYGRVSNNIYVCNDGKLSIAKAMSFGSFQTKVCGTIYNEINDYIPYKGVDFYTKNGEFIHKSTQDGSLIYFYYPKKQVNSNFITHINKLLIDKLWIFLVTIGAMTVIVFLFNDKIKAR